MKIQISIIQLKNLLQVAELAKRKDSSLSNTIEIELVEETQVHTGTDKCKFRLLSNYAEANGEFLGTN